jgi:hypothetical protein
MQKGFFQHTFIFFLATVKIKFQYISQVDVCKYKLQGLSDSYLIL